MLQQGDYRAYRRTQAVAAAGAGAGVCSHNKRDFVSTSRTLLLPIRDIFFIITKRLF